MSIINIPGFAEDSGKAQVILGGSYIVNITRQNIGGPFKGSNFPDSKVLIVNGKVDPNEHEEQGGFELVKFLTIPDEENMSKADFEDCRRQIKNLALCCELDTESDDFTTEELVGASCRWIVIKKFNKKTKENQNQVVNFLPINADEEEEEDE